MTSPVAPRTRDVDLEDRVDDIRTRWPAVGLAVGVVREGRLVSFVGRGVADIRSRTPINEETGFRVASITKTVTAVAVMQLWEQGLLDLDAPVNRSLRAFRLIPKDQRWRPATVRDLLTHTAGVPEVVPARGALMPDFGESVPQGRSLPPLAAFYRGGLPVVAEPGSRFRYGNHSFATLGQLVEDVTGEPLDRYVRAHVFEPLGMADSGLTREAPAAQRLATGYEMGRRGPKAAPQRDPITVGAAAMFSTPADIARYVAALLGGGTNEHGLVLKPETVATMFAPQYQPDPRIPGLGLAFWRADLGGHPGVEHQGTMPGFHSQVFLAPDDDVAVIAFTNGSWRPDFWLPFETSALLQDLLGVPPDQVRTDVPRRPETWNALCGWYALEGPLTEVRMRGMFGAGVEVFVRGGQLMIRCLTPIPTLSSGFALHPDDPDDPRVFRLDMTSFGFGSMRVVFGRGEGPASRVHLDVMPVTLHRRPDRTNPRRWAVGALGALTLAGAARLIRRS